MEDREYFADLPDGVLFEALSDLLAAIRNQALDDDRYLNGVRLAEEELVRKMQLLDESYSNIRAGNVRDTKEACYNLIHKRMRERRELLARERSEEMPDTAQAPAAVDADETGEHN